MEKSNFSTSINKETLDKFKELCKESGVAINLVVETLMKQCVDGKIKFSNTIKIEGM